MSYQASYHIVNNKSWKKLFLLPSTTTDQPQILPRPENERKVNFCGYEGGFHKIGLFGLKPLKKGLKTFFFNIQEASIGSLWFNGN